MGRAADRYEAVSVNILSAAINADTELARQIRKELRGSALASGRVAST
jgi:hypothetical protein